MVPETGLEPVRFKNRGIFLPTTAFAATIILWCLWSGPYLCLLLNLVVRQEPYGLYTFLILAGTKLSSGLPFDRFHRIRLHSP